MGTWAITVYYNPKRFASRYRNFVTFRERLKPPLLTLEWSQGGNFELSDGDSDILVSVSGGDLMWQKERLLNIAVPALPASCDLVAWLDGDIYFEDDHWLQQLDASLAQTPIVQLYSEVVHLPPCGTGPLLLVRESLIAYWMKRGAASLAERMQSVGSAAVGDQSAGAVETKERLRLGGRPSSGHAWAARRALLAEHGFYDGCICGTGDVAIALAALGLQDLFPHSFPLNAHQQSHYKAWADPFAASTGGKVGLVPARIHHLFHGLLSNRQYRARLQWAAESGFDPAKDLILDGQGLWRWTNDCRLRESWMNAYFERRSEDDDPCADEPATG